MGMNKETNIPIGWKEVKLGEICHINSNSLTDKTDENFSFYYIDLSMVNDGAIEYPSNQILFKNSPSRARRIFKKGDILMSNLLGHAIIKSEVKNCICSTGFAVVEEKNGLSCNEYIYPNLFSYNIKKQIDSILVGSNYPAINSNDVKNLKILLPPLQEQKAIADILEKWDEAIEKTSKLIEAKKKRFEWFSRSFFNQKISDNWNKDALEDIGNFYNGLSGKDKNDFGSGKKYLTYMNIFTNSKIDKNGFGKVIVGENENQNLVQKGDIFFTVSSETAKEVGMTSVLLDDIEDCYLNSFCFVYRLLDSSLFAIEYLQYFFRSNLARRQIVRLAQGSTRYNISKDFLSKINLYYPDLPQQKQIAKTLNTAKKEITILEEILANYKNQKKGLMQKLLTGKIRLNLGKEATNV